MSSSPNHQNNSHVPTLNQMAARMKLPKHRWEIALSHAMTVKQKANQKNNIMGMRTAAMRPIASPTVRVAPVIPGEGAAVRRARRGQGCIRGPGRGLLVDACRSRAENAVGCTGALASARRRAAGTAITQTENGPLMPLRNDDGCGRSSGTLQKRRPADEQEA